MLQRKPLRRPVERKKIAMLRAENVKRLAKNIENAAVSMRVAEKRLEAAFNAFPAERLGEADLKGAEEAAKNFIKAREEIIRQHRKQVETAARVGMVPVQPYGSELHANYAKATVLLEKIAGYRKKLASR